VTQAAGATQRRQPATTSPTTASSPPALCMASAKLCAAIGRWDRNKCAFSARSGHSALTLAASSRWSTCLAQSRGSSRRSMRAQVAGARGGLRPRGGKQNPKRLHWPRGQHNALLDSSECESQARERQGRRFSAHSPRRALLCPRPAVPPDPPTASLLTNPQASACLLGAGVCHWCHWRYTLHPSALQLG